jgi:hypothetical protein
VDGRTSARGYVVRLVVFRVALLLLLASGSAFAQRAQVIGPTGPMP